MIAKPGKYLITTDNYFFAPDGKQYRAVWGEVTVGEFKSEFGFENAGTGHAKWFARIGSDEKGLIVAGCQIHYACMCPVKPDISHLPKSEVVQSKKRMFGQQESEIEEYSDFQNNRIYIAE